MSPKQMFFEIFTDLLDELRGLALYRGWRYRRSPCKRWGAGTFTSALWPV